MRRIVLSFIFCIPFFCDAQMQPAIIHFMFLNSSGNQSFTLYLNDKMIASARENENIDYKIYSQGIINVMVHTDFATKSLSLEVENGKEYYVGIKFKSIVNFRVDPFDSEKGIPLYQKGKSNISIEEDIKNPIGRITGFNSPNPHGTGFLINSQGYVMTNFNVVRGAKRIFIRGVNHDFDKEQSAYIVAVDRANNLAILKLESHILDIDSPPYCFGNSKKVKRAERVYSVGYPEFDETQIKVKTDVGIINYTHGLDQSISEFELSSGIRSGTSEGPVFNKNGQIIGLINSDINLHEKSEFAYALKSDYIRFFLDQLGNIEYPKENESINKLRNMDFNEQIKEISRYIYIVEGK